jgi:hypothetical protein
MLGPRSRGRRRGKRRKQGEGERRAGEKGK